MNYLKKATAVSFAFIFAVSLFGCGDTKKAIRNPNAKSPVNETAENRSEQTKDKEKKNVMAVSPEVEYNMEYEIPSFSHESGFYDSEFSLKLSVSDSSMNIYYTVDGSTPTSDSSLYDGEIKISDLKNSERVLTSVKKVSPDDYTPSVKFPAAVVIRAAAIDEKGVSGPVASNTYFVGTDRASEYGDVPVISLITDSENLFDYEKGIYVLGKAYDDWISKGNTAEYEPWRCQGNFSQKGIEWERPVNFELMEPDGTVGFEQMLGMRIMGTASRTYVQKSFRFHAREEYGEKKINYPLVPDAFREGYPEEPLTKYKTFILRNGGNDCDYTKLRDPFIQRLVKGRAFTTQASRPAVVFINGEYWGLYAIGEDYSDNFIQYNYDIDKNDVVMIKCEELEEGQDGDEALYDELVSLISTDLTDPEAYDRLCERLDIQSAVDYFCTVILTGNEDCMINLDNNWRLWRSRSVTDHPYQDGKWRFMLYDTEYSLGLYKNGENAQYNSLNDAFNSKIFGWLRRNMDFKKQFVLTYMDMANFIFSPGNAFPVLDELSRIYAPLEEDSRYRFGPQWTQYPGYFENGISQIKNYMRKRSDYAPKMLAKQFELSPEPYELTVECSAGGRVKINTVTPDYSSGSASGLYFSDYPVTLTAVCDEGYRFDGWSGSASGNSETVTLTVSEAMTAAASFSLL